MTWTNNSRGDDVVWERLDRGFVNSNWFQNHDNAQLINLSITFSDQGAIWITYPECDEVIRQAWNNSVS